MVMLGEQEAERAPAAEVIAVMRPRVLSSKEAFKEVRRLYVRIYLSRCC
jgi:hypothetical protein